MMAYCYPRWIDYNYEKLVRWVQLSQAWQRSLGPFASLNPAGRSASQRP
jgi:hypothetical protein